MKSDPDVQIDRAVYRDGANRADLADARPAMPKGVRDRPAEVWEALIAIADTAGGEWPDKARAACRHFVLDSDPEELSLGARLLRDVRAVFKERDAMWSADIIADLTDGEESEWADLWGKPLDQRRLAAWERYLPSENPSVSGTTDTDGTSQVRAGFRPEHVRNTSGTSAVTVPDRRNKRNTSGTQKTISDQQKQPAVPVVPDVPHTDGSPRPQHIIPPEERAALGRCHRCEWHMETQGHAPGCPNRQTGTE
ncbi:DUF3631 domain-containing protein [Gordonia sp. VNK1]|uniref:DUF3631 domain-containing protein n=1 Tax=Gordonia oleivorans TaxID=3156618 RepID=UPI0032B50047